MIYISDKLVDSRSFYYDYDKEGLDAYINELIKDAPYEHKILYDTALVELNFKSDDIDVRNFEYHYNYRNKYLNIDGKLKPYPLYDITYDKLILPEEVRIIHALRLGNYDEFLNKIDEYPNLKEYFDYFIVTVYSRFQTNISSSVVINNHSKIKKLKR